MLSLTHSIIFLLLLCSCCAVNLSVTKQRIVDVWKKNEDGVNTYRIPVISYTPFNNYLIALSEARRFSASDFGTKYIALKISKDGGSTWGNNTFIYSTKAHCTLNVGAILVDDIYKTLHFYFTESIYNHNNVYSNYVMNSTNDGLTWSSPRNISDQIGTVMFTPGPGHGLQLKNIKKGRYLICGHSTIQADGLRCIYSDDFGRTYKNGIYLPGIPYGLTKRTGDFVPDENQFIELEDGTIVFNVRNQAVYRGHFRLRIISRDCGESVDMKSIQLDETLITPVCNAGLIRIRDWTFFSNPATQHSRTNLTLRWSNDNGFTWKGALVLHKNAAAYSSINYIPNITYNNKLFVIFEGGKSDAYEKIKVAIVKYEETTKLTMLIRKQYNI